jgi:hypothetical protein
MDVDRYTVNPSFVTWVNACVADLIGGRNTLLACAESLDSTMPQT